jgi:AcrR family transcriptional regulator
VSRASSSRQLVGHAALSIAIREGIDKVTMRGVADLEGFTTAMALYTYVSSRDDLIAAMAEQVIELHVAEALAAHEPKRPDVVRACRLLLVAEVVNGARMVPEDLLDLVGIEVSRPCRHVWSPVDAAPDCTGTVYECIDCGAESCFDDGAWADIATDDAVGHAVEQRIKRQEATGHGF